MLTADIVAAPTSLCVAVLPLQQTMVRGNAGQWAVAAWTVGGEVTGATIKLGIGPAGSGTPIFGPGCASGEGTSSCALSTLSPASAQQQLRAAVTVPLAAATVNAVTLTATVSAPGLATGPAASGTITVLTPGTPAAASSTPASSTPASTATQPAQTSPGVGVGLVDPTSPGVSLTEPTFPPYSATDPAPTLSPGSAAGGLFPSVSPSSPLASGTVGTSGTGGTRPVANTTTGPAGGSSTLGPEVVGLAALALALVLAFTRVSLRRPRPAAAGTAAPPAPAAPPPAVPATFAPPPAAAPTGAAEPAQESSEILEEPQ